MALVPNRSEARDGRLAAECQIPRTLVKPPKPAKVGTPGKGLLRFAGTINHEDAQQMLKASEEESEQIAANEW